VEESEPAPEASTTGKSSAGSSRFAYNMLTEDEAVKAPGVTRGKDGHVSLGNNDFFSNPLGGSASGKRWVADPRAYKRTHFMFCYKRGCRARRDSVNTVRDCTNMLKAKPSEWPCILIVTIDCWTPWLGTTGEW